MGSFTWSSFETTQTFIMFSLKTNFLILFSIVLVSCVQSYCIVQTTSYQACQELCRLRVDCERWERQPNGNCYLKTRYGWTAKYVPGIYSGFKDSSQVESNTQSMGADLTCTPENNKSLCVMNVKDASDCQKACQNVKDCGRWEYKEYRLAHGLNCFLKSMYGWTAQYAKQHVSGYRHGGHEKNFLSHGADLKCNN